MKANVPTLHVKTGRSYVAMTAGQEGQPVWTNYDSALKAIEGYSNNHVVFTCVHEISTSAGSVPFKMINVKDGSDVEDHPIINLFKKPNPYQAASSFWECVYAFYLLHGNSYIEAADKSGSESPRQIEELYCLPPKSMKIILGKTGVSSYQFEGPTGNKVNFLVDILTGQSPCMHWKTFNPDNIWMGLAAISAIGRSVDIHNSTNNWNKALLDNGARPSGAFVYDDEDAGILTDPQYDRLKEQVTEEYSGAKNAGKAMLLEGGMKWQAMALSPIDMDYINSKNISARDIAVAYGYPPVLLGLPEDNTYNNQKEARLALWTDTIVPTVTSLCDHLNRWLLPMFNEDVLDVKIVPDFESIGALQSIRDAQWLKAKESGEILTINERRKLVGYMERKGLDSMLVNATLVPIEYALKAPTDSTSGGGKQAEVGQFDDIAMKASQIPMEVKEGSEQDRREAMAQNKLRIALERLHVEPLAIVLEKAAKLSSDKYKKNKGAEAALSILSAELQAGIRPILKAIYAQASDVSGKRVLEGMKSAVPALEAKAPEALTNFELDVMQWITTHSLSTSSTITETMMDAARKLLVQSAVIQGNGVQETATQLYELLGGEASKSRAATIVATEVHKAFNTASKIAADATGLQYDKRWLSVKDTRTRASHMGMDGKTVGKEEQFQVGTAFLRYPGDPECFDAKEVINCRCAVRYIPKGI